jgi:hypothetical protein
LLKNRLIRFSFFKGTPLFLRSFLYDDGDWLVLHASSDSNTTTVLNDYALLDMLPNLTVAAESDNGSYNTVYAHLPHGTAFFQAPLYVPAQHVDNYGGSILKNEQRYHTAMASFLLLKKWFKFLRENDVYDNTRIILVSDHGRGNANFPENMRLPNGDCLQSYNALLMVKEFNAQDTGNLTIDNSFMTSADAALFAVRDFADRNPFTGNLLAPDKSPGIDIATIGALSTYSHGTYAYTIKQDQWLHVYDNVFDINKWNWEK